MGFYLKGVSFYVMKLTQVEFRETSAVVPNMFKGLERWVGGWVGG